jgi:hypothetical protein
MPYWLASQRPATSLFEGSTFWSSVAPANFRLKRRVALVLLSCGWLFPLWLAYDSLLSYIAYEVIPETQGKVPLTSFPHRDFSRQLAAIAAIWLALAVSYWVIAAMRQDPGRRRVSPPVN